RGLPYHRVQKDRRVEPDDVLALVDHRPPPGVLDVALEQHAHRPVVPRAVDATVKLRRLKDEAAPLGQRHDLFHQAAVFWLLGCLVRGHAALLNGTARVIFYEKLDNQWRWRYERRS